MIGIIFEFYRIFYLVDVYVQAILSLHSDLMINSGINIRFTIGLCFLASCMVVCSGDPKENTSAHVKSDDPGRIAALPMEARAPAYNPTTPEKNEPGRLLFWDPVLSGNKDLACASCHHPEFGYAENLDISIGVNGKGFGQKRVFREPNGETAEC
jgi:cytochrome c peroxidase